MKKVSNILFVLMLFGIGFFLWGCYSCESYHDWKGTGPVPPEVANKFFWSKDCRPIAEAVPALIKQPVPVKPTTVAMSEFGPYPAPVKPTPVAMSECGPYIVSRNYPSQDVLRLDKIMPKEVQLNAPFDYSIIVTNLTPMVLADVVITENLPKNFKFTRANPTATKDGNKLAWTIESLGPKDSEEIKVFGMATDTGCLIHCSGATYVIPACANVIVVQAKLRLTKTTPTEALLCDPIPVEFVVTNSGSGAAQNVKVVDTLPAGLRTADGKTQIVFNAGTLAAGQSKQFSTRLKASKTGKYVNKAVATAAAGLRAEATTTTVVRQPVLTITKTGPKRQYLGRSVQYDITVTNKGDAPAAKTIVEDTIPQGVTSLKATTGYKVVGSKLVWELGTLAVNASRKVSVSYMPTKAGTLSNTATAVAYCADAVTASVKTSAVGIPAVLLEVIDIEDPVEVGSQTTYVITATNQGSMADTNILIVCTFEDNQQYVSSSGATTALLEGNTVKFAPLARLATKAKATWRVIVRAVKPGDVRFKVTMNTDELERPVEETEATRLYE